MTNEIKVTLFIAARTINKFMESCDLKHSKKWYVIATYVTYVTDKEINSDYFMKLIENSKNNYIERLTDHWSPAIIYEGHRYVDPEVLEITDGNNTMFITENLSNNK